MCERVGKTLKNVRKNNDFREFAGFRSMPLACMFAFPPGGDLGLGFLATCIGDWDIVLRFKNKILRQSTQNENLDQDVFFQILKREI